MIRSRSCAAFARATKRKSARIREEVMPISSAAEEAGTIFPHSLARLSSDIYSTIARALGELERRLLDD